MRLHVVFMKTQIAPRKFEQVLGAVMEEGQEPVMVMEKMVRESRFYYIFIIFYK